MHGVVGIGAGLQLPLLEDLAPGQVRPYGAGRYYCSDKLKSGCGTVVLIRVVHYTFQQKKTYTYAPQVTSCSVRAGEQPESKRPPLVGC